MHRHLASCKKNPNRTHDPKQGTLQATPGVGVNNWKYDPDALRKAFAEMVIEDELPFAFGEKSGFLKFMSKACPRFKPPSRRTCAREVVKTYLSEKAKLMKFFKENCASVSEKEKENINFLIFVAVALDPRYKLSDYTKISIEEMYGLEMGEKVWTAINKCVRELFEEYRMQSYSPAAVTTSTNQALSEGGGSMMKQLIANRLRQSNSSNGGSKSELDKYLAEDCEDPETKLDILAWWSVNSSRFPTLAKMARDVLAIPISTVASESAFSTSGRILNDFRTSLTPFMVQALVCTQDWLRRSTDPVDIQENLEALEELEKELLEELGDKGKGKRKADGSAIASPATGKSSKFNN